MNIQDIRKMNQEEILNAIEDKKAELFNFRFQRASGQLEDQNAITRTRHIIARLKTALRELQVQKGG